MEYLLVKFNRNEPQARSVIANGAVIGPANTTLMLQANFYVIKLSGAGYVPTDWQGDISGTLPNMPKVIVFT